MLKKAFRLGVAAILLWLALQGPVVRPAYADCTEAPGGPTCPK